MFESANTAAARLALGAVTVDEQLEALEACRPDAWTLEVVEALDPARLDGQQLVRTMVLAERLSAHCHAIALSAAAAIRSTEGPDDWAQDEVACALGVGSQSGSRFLTTARALSGRLRLTGELLAAGLISARKADVLAERTARLDDAAAAEVEAAVLPEAADQTPWAFDNAVKAAVITADPVDAARRARDARTFADVRTRALPDAMAQLVVDGRADEVLAAWQLLDGLAGPGHPDDPRSAGERRVDAFFGLVDERYAAGNLPTRKGKPISLGVTMTLATAMGAANIAANLDGYGPIPADLARELAANATWRAWIADAGTAHLIALGTKSYRPDQATADYVTSRDGTCTFPFCDLPASRCDLDHVVPFHEGGTTTPDNLAGESRRHHRNKHGPWTLTRQPDGSSTWTSPLGFSYTTQPRRQPLDPIYV